MELVRTFPNKAEGNTSDFRKDEIRLQESNNQQIIKQNIQLHAQLRSMQKQFQEKMHENLELETQNNLLKEELITCKSELEACKVIRHCTRSILFYFWKLKKEVFERVPTLKLIASHMNELSQFLEQISRTSIASLGNERKEMVEDSKPMKESSSRSTNKENAKPVLTPIKETDGNFYQVSLL